MDGVTTTTPTSVRLTPSQRERLTASGMTLAQVIERGLSCTHYHDEQAQLHAQLTQLRAELLGRVEAVDTRVSLHLASHPAPCRHQRAETSLRAQMEHQAHDLAAAFPGPFTVDAAAGLWNTARRTADTRIHQLLAGQLIERVPPPTRPGAGSASGRIPNHYRVTTALRATEEGHTP